MADTINTFNSINESDLVREVNINKYYNSARLKEEVDPYVKGIPYMFITTPLLNLVEGNTSTNTFFSFMANMHPEILGMLNYGAPSSTTFSTTSPFIKPLCNSFKNIDLRATTARTKEINETWYGHKQSLPGSLINSINGSEFSVSYLENKDLIVTNLHKIWLEYTELVRRGDFYPSDAATDGRYIDYLSTVYYFVVDFDGETILYYCKYTGVAPLNVPYTSLGAAVGDKAIAVELSVNYLYSYKEDLDPSILSDFNYLNRSPENLVNLPTDNEILLDLKKDPFYVGTDADYNSRLQTSTTMNNHYYVPKDTDKNQYDLLHDSQALKSNVRVVMVKSPETSKYKFKLKFF